MLRALPVPPQVAQSIAEALLRTQLSPSLSPSTSIEMTSIEPATGAACKSLATRTCRFSVSGLTCADCSLLVESKLMATSGVVSAQVSCLTFEATAEYDPDLVSASSLLDAINSTGFKGAILRDQSTAEFQQGGKPNHLHTSLQAFPPLNRLGTKLSDAEVDRIHQTLVAVPGVASVGQAKRVTAKPPLSDVPPLPGVPQVLYSAAIPGTSLMLDTVKAIEMEVEYDAERTGPRGLLAAVQVLQYPAHILSAVELASRHEDGEHGASRMWRLRVPTGVLLSIPMIFLAFIIPTGAFGSLAEAALAAEVISGRRGLSVRTLLSLILTTPIQFYVGSPLFVSAYRAARFSKTANIDTLVVISSSVAYFYSLAIVIAKLIGAGVTGMY
jgi:Cu+-exporting ATPase